MTFELYFIIAGVWALLYTVSVAVFMTVDEYRDLDWDAVVGFGLVGPLLWPLSAAGALGIGVGLWIRARRQRRLAKAEEMKQVDAALRAEGIVP